MKLRLLGLALGIAVLYGLTHKGHNPPSNLQLAASVVRVLNYTGNGGGTGFVTTAKSGRKVIVTNSHVCRVTATPFIRVDADSGSSTLNEKLSDNFNRDICVLSGIEAPALGLAQHGPLRFDTVKVMGHALLGPMAPAIGVFTGLGLLPIGMGPDKDGKCHAGTDAVESVFGTFCVLTMELGTTTAEIYPGNSGSPIVNADGEVIGVINSADSTMNRGNFVPLNHLKEELNAL